MHEALGNETGVILNVQAMQWPDWRASLEKVGWEEREGAGATNGHNLGGTLVVGDPVRDRNGSRVLRGVGGEAR